MKKALTLLLVIIALTIMLASCFGWNTHYHHYKAVVTQPTCTEQGYTTYTCKCGDSFVGNYTDPAHIFGDWIIIEEATKTENGLKEGTCHCGEKGEAIIPYTGSKGLSFSLDDDGVSYKVSGIGTCTDSDIVIPNTYKDLPVTSIGSGAFTLSESFTGISIPDSVTNIDSDAFAGCTALTSIVIPDSVTNIGYNAFAACTALTSIVIPDSVTSIGNWAFADCDSLTSVKISNFVKSMGEGVFTRCDSLTSIEVDEDNEYYCSIDGNLYNKNATILIQYGVAKTDTFFTIPDSVMRIDEGAFYGCTSLTSIVIPDSVMRIDEFAFYGCTSLTSIEIGDSVKSVGRLAFPDWNTLQCVEYDNAYYIGNENNPYVVLIKAKNEDITNCEIHPDTRVIYYYAFYNCELLASVEIPDSVKSIGCSAFGGCDSLISVIIPASVTSIDEWAFSSCLSLTSVVIPDSVISIGRSAFAYSNSITIYCEAKSQPAGWDDEWNYSKKPVVWGYTGE